MYGLSITGGNDKMKHKKCGGKIVLHQKSEALKVYKCNRCGHEIFRYHKK